MKAKTIIIALAALAMMAGCKKEEPQPVEPQSLVKGTKWTTSYSDNIMVLEFTSDNEVVGYFANASGTILGNAFRGNYDESGSTVVFSGLKYMWIYAHYELISGTVSGSIMTTHGRETWDIESGDWWTWDKTWNKQ